MYGKILITIGICRLLQPLTNAERRSHMDNKNKKLPDQIAYMLVALQLPAVTAVCIIIFFLGKAGALTTAVVLALLLAVTIAEFFMIRRKTNSAAIKPLDEVRDSVQGYVSGKNGDGFREQLKNISTGNEIEQLIKAVANMSYEADEHIKSIEAAGENKSKLTEDILSALADAVDSKDRYTRGHSSRVAEYSRKIAKQAGKSDEDCEKIYYAALLHDVGKIGIPESIINKKGRLTDEEYEYIKQHPTVGAQILQGIKEAPYLSIAARHHHERYDGNGYPDHLKGTDIPEIARIISVADAYDAMTSRRSYRAPIPQRTVREELVKGSGTQFDPGYAEIMLKLIDLDIEYEMIDGSDSNYLSSDDELIIDSHRSDVSPGIQLTSSVTKIHIKVKPFNRSSGVPARPSLILYAALDGQIHTDIKDIKDLDYFEYGEIWFDGNVNALGARKIQTTTSVGGSGKADEYDIEAVKCKDHALIKITGETQTHEMIVAFPDITRFAHIAFTGEHCSYTGVSVEQTEEEVSPDMIPRIAEEISFIDGPEGDIPSIQIDGFRTAATQGIPIEDGMQIKFRAKSLPTARLVWHCPYLNIFTSDDAKVFGENYHDYMLMRIDGECWEGDPASKVNSFESKTSAFPGWTAWKARNKEGIDCTFSFERKDNVITVTTENNGISVKATADITDTDKNIYAAVTGDQCVVTDIRIIQNQRG